MIAPTLLEIVFYLFISAILACFLHEGGHAMTAQFFGQTINFEFSYGMLFGVVPIPRGIWYMPAIEPWKQKTIAIMGFGTEFLMIPIIYCAYQNLGIFYTMVAFAHLFAYPFYCGEANDFKWFQ